MIPLVPPRAFGAVTQLDDGKLTQTGVDKELVIVELSRNPSLNPTPKKRRSVVPSKNSVSGEHSSPKVLLITKLDEPVLVMMPLAKGNIYISGFEGTPPAFTKPHAMMCPDAEPSTQNALSNAPSCALLDVQSPSPVPEPRFTVFVASTGVEVVKFAGSCV